MENSTYGFWYDFARDFIIPTMVPLITALIAIFGVWYTVRTNTNHSNKLREEARKKELSEKNKDKYYNLITHFESILSKDNTTQYIELEDQDGSTGEIFYRYIRYPNAKNPVFKEKEVYEYNNVLLEILSTDNYKKWEWFKSLFRDNIEETRLYNLDFEQHSWLSTFENAPEEYSKDSFKIEINQIKKRIEKTEVSHIKILSKYSSSQILKRMVVISLLEFVYALKVEISSIQVEFEVYVKESVKQGKVDFELYDEDLERYNKLKSGKILK